MTQFRLHTAKENISLMERISIQGTYVFLFQAQTSYFTSTAQASCTIYTRNVALLARKKSSTGHQ